jgi:hypothetical protein
MNRNYLSLDAYQTRKKSKTLSQLQDLYPGRPYPIFYSVGIPNENGLNYSETFDARRLYEGNYQEWLRATTMAAGEPKQYARPAVSPDEAFQNPQTFSGLIRLDH